MSGGPTEEHEELRGVVRRFLSEKSDLTRARALVEAGEYRDEAVWTQLAGQLMVQGIAVPERYGGAGYGPVELGIVLEEMGRFLSVAPYFATVALAGQLLTSCSDAAARETWLPGIASGSMTATVAIGDDTGEIAADAVTTVAEREGDGWRLTGTKRFVIDGTTADLLIVAALTDGVVTLFTVAGGATGVRREPLPNLDPTRPLATVEFSGAPAVRIADDATTLLPRVADLAAAALAAEQAGGAAAALDTAVEYARVRVQFDRPIGSFQAIKHRCADLLLEVESARNAAFAATSLLATGDPEGPLAASLAAAWARRTFTHVAKENIQILGGIGFTWEHDAHLFLKRAKAGEMLLGTTARHRARVGALAGIRGAE
ncbi:acyl-CoA dehydrogenase family protein [Nocardia shimofusensis]|uniref:acyl-CoA dehydrogenase family protein n=1 Tax=Nocardia shimofusensis TaxID=228596 RepID=UPI00083163B2|nr:acyl-CoA dehydrogenase family protein [Nocardia shimofusensis]